MRDSFIGLSFDLIFFESHLLLYSFNISLSVFDFWNFFLIKLFKASSAFLFFSIILSCSIEHLFSIISGICSRPEGFLSNSITFFFLYITAFIISSLFISSFSNIFIFFHLLNHFFTGFLILIIFLMVFLTVISLISIISFLLFYILIISKLLFAVSDFCS